MNRTSKKHDIIHLIFLHFSVERSGLANNFIKLLCNKIIEMRKTITEEEKERRYRCLSNILGYFLYLNKRERERDSHNIYINRLLSIVIFLVRIYLSYIL